MPNQLLKAKSPYLAQHAQNPVEWVEWSDDVLLKAHKENKLLLISIGYSACHWCHVMAHESFEDEQTAQLMNNHFINIKIDREERPDLDAIYMDACQLITGNGGWPLYVFALPNGDPFHAGTYFKKPQWQQILMQIAQLWQQEPNKIHDYAKNLKEGILKSSAVIDLPEKNNSTIKDVLADFKNRFDIEHGGFNRAPKFPMPVVWSSLLHWSFKWQIAEVKNHVHHTLNQMALGGIYDFVEGGFARYSVDAKWFAPHFEKMLYDNAQLISLYSKASTYFNHPQFLKIAEETAQFVITNWKAEDNGYYSAYDADSEGVEGKYYCLDFNEFNNLEIEHKNLFKKYFQISELGNWEHNLNILYPVFAPEKFAELEQLIDFGTLLNQWQQSLKQHRTQKIKPGLDDKQNTHWNALLLSAFCDIYAANEQEVYKIHAEQLLTYLTRNCWRDKEILHIVKNKEGYITGFLEDYAALAAALITYYETFKEEGAIIKANEIVNSCITAFYKPEHGFFSSAHQGHHTIIDYKFEVTDNVIPSANAVMCEVLLKTGLIMENNAWLSMAENMLDKMQNKTLTYPDYYAKWLDLLAQRALGLPFAVGNKAPENKQKQQLFTIAHYKKDSKLPSVYNKQWLKEPTIYLCQNHVCNAAVGSWEDVKIKD